MLCLCVCAQGGGEGEGGCWRCFFKLGVDFAGNPRIVVVIVKRGKDTQGQRQYVLVAIW